MAKRQEKLNKDEKGNVLFKYRPNQVEFLKKKGHLAAIEEAEEF